MNPAATTAVAVEAEIVQRIDAMPVRDDPFPHIYIDGIFPDGFYAEMLRQIPSRDFYKKITETGRASGDAYEQRLILHLARLDGLPPEQRAFWKELASWFVGSELASALARAFAPVIAENSGRDPRKLDYGVEAMLVKDLDGYMIGPHTDILSRAVSVMFYLPPDKRYERYGTALYAPKESGFTSDGSSHLSFDAFDLVETMPCRPNSMFGFARSNRSFHGVEPIRHPGIERDVLLYILRWRPQAAIPWLPWRARRCG
jgi:hypothetical protein